MQPGGGSPCLGVPSTAPLTGTLSLPSLPPPLPRCSPPAPPSWCPPWAASRTRGSAASTAPQGRCAPLGGPGWVAASPAPLQPRFPVLLLAFSHPQTLPFCLPPARSPPPWRWSCMMRSRGCRRRSTRIPLAGCALCAEPAGRAGRRAEPARRCDDYASPLPISLLCRAPAVFAAPRSAAPTTIPWPTYVSHARTRIATVTYH